MTIEKDETTSLSQSDSEILFESKINRKKVEETSTSIIDPMEKDPKIAVGHTSSDLMLHLIYPFKNKPIIFWGLIIVLVIFLVAIITGHAFSKQNILCLLCIVGIVYSICIILVLVDKCVKKW